jgi:hypothetical protein
MFRSRDASCDARATFFKTKQYEVDSERIEKVSDGPVGPDSKFGEESG